MKRSLAIFSLLSVLHSNAQDILGARIEVQKISANTHAIQLVLISDASIPPDPSNVEIHFGNGQSAFHAMSYSTSANGIRRSVYAGYYTYANAGLYKIYYIGGSRVAGIKNISNSAPQSVYVESFVSVNNFITVNSSPSVCTQPVYFTVSGNQVSYNANCVDAENDSLSYELRDCYGNYYKPSNAVLDPVNGTLSFSKDSVGKYAFKTVIKEWRKTSAGAKAMIGYTEFDFVMDINSAVGLEQIKNELQTLSLAPNPSAGKFAIVSENNALIIDRIVIANPLGQTLFVLNNQPVNTPLQLDVPPGLYIIELEDKGSKHVLKLIKD